MENQENNQNKIKSLVLSGGGVQLFGELGILHSLITSNKLNISDITHYYGTSAGSIIILSLSFGIDIDVICNYFVKRPWDQLFKIDIFNFVYLFSNCCLIKKDLIIESLRPLFETANIDIDIDFETFYKMTNKELHIFSTNITDGKCEDISHITHPKWKLTDAIHASCCIPILFEPINISNKYYIDGGLLNNFPIKNASTKFKNDEICGIHINHSSCAVPNTNYSNIIEFLQILLLSIFTNFFHVSNYDASSFNNIYYINSDEHLNIFTIVNCFSDKNIRIKYFELGKQLV